MRVRDLKFGRINAWPPSWRARSDVWVPLGQEGILVRADVRSSTSLIVLVRHENQDCEGLLNWDGPPKSAALAAHLNRFAGWALLDVGKLWIPDLA